MRVRSAPLRPGASPMNMMRAFTDPFSWLSTAARSHIAGHLTQAAASLTKLMNAFCLAVIRAGLKDIDLSYAPHEKSVIHRHPATVAVFLTDGKVKFTYPDGRTEEREIKAGQAVWNPATRHLPENVADTEMEAIVIEFKVRRPAPKKPPNSGATTPPRTP